MNTSQYIMCLTSSSSSTPRLTQYNTNRRAKRTSCNGAERNAHLAKERLRPRARAPHTSKAHWNTRAARCAPRGRHHDGYYFKRVKKQKPQYRTASHIQAKNTSRELAHMSHRHVHYTPQCALSTSPSKTHMPFYIVSHSILHSFTNIKYNRWITHIVSEWALLIITTEQAHYLCFRQSLLHNISHIQIK